jgi:hypothetical protein
MSSGQSTTLRRSPWTLPPTYVGWFFLWTSGVHVGIVAADPGLYRHFADGSLVPALAEIWRSTFMGHPVIYGLVVALGEATLAMLLLGPRERRHIGWIGTIAFHVALMCFGWGFWLWCVPALALLLRGARADRATADGPGSSRSMTVVGPTR